MQQIPTSENGEAESIMNHIFCIAHKEIEYKLPENTTIIWTGSSKVQHEQPLTSYRLIDISEELDFYYPYLSGSAGTFAILELFLNKKINISLENDLITVMQYRKFLHPDCLGYPSLSYPGMRIINNTEISKPTPFQNINLSGLLICRPKAIGNIYHQYCQAHRAPDILRYTAVAIDLGVLTPNESISFLNSDIIIPGGSEFGTFPAHIFLKIISKIEDICINFIKNHQVSDFNPYQRRALAFCNERMSGYLLMKYLSEAGVHIENNMIGEMHCVLRNQQDYSGGE